MYTKATEKSTKAEKKVGENRKTKGKKTSKSMVFSTLIFALYMHNYAPHKMSK